MPRGHRGQPRLHQPGPAGATGQLLDVVDVEEAAPAVVARVRDEQAAADVGVEGGQLHPEPPRRLLALEHPGHASRLREKH